MAIIVKIQNECDQALGLNSHVESELLDQQSNLEKIRYRKRTKNRWSFNVFETYAHTCNFIMN